MNDKCEQLFKQIYRAYIEKTNQLKKEREELSALLVELNEADNHGRQLTTEYNQLLEQLEVELDLVKNYANYEAQLKREEARLASIASGSVDDKVDIALEIDSVRADLELLKSKRDRELEAVADEVIAIVKHEQQMEEDKLNTEKRKLEEIEQQANQELSSFEVELTNRERQREDAFNVQHRKRLEELEEIKRRCDDESVKKMRQLNESELVNDLDISNAKLELSKEVALLSELGKSISRGPRHVSFNNNVQLSI